MSNRKYEENNDLLKVSLDEDEEDYLDLLDNKKVANHNYLLEQEK